MKSRFFKIISQAAFLLAVFAFLTISSFMMTSCDIISGSGSGSSPEIIAIRYLDPEMDNAEMDDVVPGDHFVIHGRNLKTTRRIYINGVAITFNPVYVTDTDIVLQARGNDLDFGNLDPFSEDIGFIRVVTKYGEVRHEFPVVPEFPIIDRISHEFAKAGAPIQLIGRRLYMIQRVEFPGGIETTEFMFDTDGEWLEVIVPDGVTEGGNIFVHGPGRVNRPSLSPEFNSTRGMLTDFDEYDLYLGGATAITDDPGLFSGGRGNYAYLHVSDYESPASPDEWGKQGNAVHLDKSQFFEPEDLEDPRAISVRQYSIKMDINIPEAWDRGRILVLLGENLDYALTFAPWDDRTNPGPYSTEGWETVELSIQTMRDNYGRGRVMRSVDQFLDEKGQTAISIVYVNDSGQPVPEFRLGIDNIRFLRVSGPVL